MGCPGIGIDNVYPVAFYHEQFSETGDRVSEAAYNSRPDFFQSFSGTFSLWFPSVQTIFESEEWLSDRV